MKSKRKAVPGVAAPKDGKVERSTFPGEANSDFYSTMKRGRVSSILMTGSKNALPVRDIKRIMGIKAGRDITALIEKERHSGIPVCASSDGYYLPGTPGELEEYTVRLQRRIRTITGTLDALKASLKEWANKHE